jgi:predicted  nucleic acid-binding Zn-ribbon protein
MKTNDTEVLDLSKQIDKIMLEMSQADKQIKELNENVMEIQKLISDETNTVDTGATTSKATQDGMERSRTKSESTSPITSFLVIIAVTLLLLLLFNKSVAELDDSVILPPI